MFSNKILKTILSSLPDLTDGQLSVVIAAASQLRAEKLSAPSSRRSAARSGHIPAKQGSSKKGPSKMASPWEKIPEHREFKAAEKAMKSLIKQKDMSLKEAYANPETREDPVIKKFKTAQAVWFRVKVELAGSAAKSSKAQTQEEKEEESSDGGNPTGGDSYSSS
jgi:hypothetical protein